MKHLYHPRALQRALNSSGYTEGSVGDPFIDEMMGLLRRYEPKEDASEKENILQFKRKVIEYFEINTTTAPSTRVDYAPEYPLSDWASGLSFYFPSKSGIFANDEGDITEYIGYRAPYEKLIFIDCTDQVADINVEVLTQKLQDSLRDLPLSEQSKNECVEILKAQLTEIIEDFDLLKEYSTLGTSIENRMTPKYLAELAVLRISKEAEMKLFQLLIKQIDKLQKHTEQQDPKSKSSKHRQEAHQWTQALMTTVHDFFEGRITFTQFKSSFETHCSKDKINHLTDYKSYIERVLQAFQKLIYNFTHLQFFKSSPTTAEFVHEIVDAKDKLMKPSTYQLPIL